MNDRMNACINQNTIDTPLNWKTKIVSDIFCRKVFCLGIGTQHTRKDRLTFALHFYFSTFIVHVVRLLSASCIETIDSVWTTRKKKQRCDTDYVLYSIAQYTKSHCSFEYTRSLHNERKENCCSTEKKR